MAWYIYVLVGIILGGFIFNKKMRDSLFGILDSLSGKKKDHAEDASSHNIITRTSDEGIEADSYSVPVHCTNCPFRGRITIRRGQTKNQVISRANCPDCGCNTLRG